MAGRRVTCNIRVEVLRQFWRTDGTHTRVGEILMVDIATARRLYASKGVKPAPLTQTPSVQTQSPTVDHQSPAVETQTPMVQSQTVASHNRNKRK